MSQTNVTWYVSDLKLGVCVEFQRWTGVEKRCRIGAIMRCASTDPPDCNCDTSCEHEELSVTLTLIHRIKAQCPHQVCLLPVYGRLAVVSISLIVSSLGGLNMKDPEPRTETRDSRAGEDARSCGSWRITLEAMTY
jgi:hypothetical protein